MLVEADYSQLEMAVLAAVSGDKKLLHDISSGVDMHTELFRNLYGSLPSKEQRKRFKRCAFALVYGAGAHGISEQGGVTKEEAKEFIKVFYERYPDVARYHGDMQMAVVLGRVYKGDKDEKGNPYGKCFYTSPLSKRIYVFREYENEPPSWGTRKSTMQFSATETKNYPIQGGATGDIVPLMVGVLYRVLKNHPVLHDKCLMVNTVHDSIVFDVHNSVKDEALRVIYKTLTAAKKHIDKTFSWQTFPLELGVGISVGPNWLDQIEYNTDLLKDHHD